MSVSTVSVKDIIPETIQATLIEDAPVDGNVSRDELEIISRLVAYLKPQNIFEFGTFDGRTTINMATHARTVRVCIRWTCHALSHY